MRRPDQLIVRPARHEDIPTITAFSAAMALETEGRQLDPARLREGTTALLESADRGLFMVAEIAHADHTQVVGQLMITYEWSDWRNGRFWWIQSVYVAPAFRRQGVFRTMHNTLVAQAKGDPQVCGIRLYVEQDNRAAQDVYRRVGLASSTYAVYEQDFVLARHPSPPRRT